ncbi:MAG: hypothetical protein VX466_12400 [Myxococcota bacterium]|nr:hypothetical protein [Myxococcota bacterium]
MLDLLSWIGLAVVVLAVAYLLTSLFWRPERNIHRAMLGHWFRSLIRLYESDSLVCVSHRDSGIRFTLLRRSGSGARCWVVLSCPRSRWMAFDLDPVRAAVAGEPRVLVLPESSGRDDGRLDVQVSIPNIWASDAADDAIRVADYMLDAHGVGSEAFFDLEFMGEQSVERALEARRRRQHGEIEEW